MPKTSFNGHAGNCTCKKCKKSRTIFLREKEVKMGVKPWAHGFNDHARVCECNLCLRDRMEAFKKWFLQQKNLPSMPDSTRTVFVRPHWRRHRNHLFGMPRFRSLLIREFSK